VENVGIERVAILAEEDPLCQFPERHETIQYIGGDRKPSGSYNCDG
jgi:hypothetical protein